MAPDSRRALQKTDSKTQSDIVVSKLTSRALGRSGPGLDVHAEKSTISVDFMITSRSL